jgi:hypothetical protein
MARQKQDKPKPDTKRCDLCGRVLRDKYGKPYEHAIWCSRCLKTHAIYPEPCLACDGFYHFPPGMSEEGSPEHLARLADIARGSELFDQRIKERQQQWKLEAPERERAEAARRIRERLLQSVPTTARIRSSQMTAGERIRAKFLGSPTIPPEPDTGKPSTLGES